ncbi:recombinase family protein [Devosia sp. XK-2]|uniref:recombinase family protein n=1 Tax=Devosia sp. XK-2 TaxID=3126689 RepID=UPI0030CBAF8C
MRKIGYLRVSTEEQRPDRQIDGLRTECDELHIETLSAVSKKRPIYEAVIEKLRPGDMLVVWDLDRAYRSARDALNEFSALDQRGVAFRVVNFPIDARTAEGYYCFTVMSANNELERRILSRRTKEGLAAARARGKILGRPYKLSSDQIAHACREIGSRRITVTEMARQYDVGRWTLTKAMRRHQSTEAT